MNAETPPERGRRRTGTGRVESYTDHQTYMRQLDERIRWLSTRRSDGRYPTHWWLREFIKRRDVA